MGTHRWPTMRGHSSSALSSPPSSWVPTCSYTDWLSFFYSSIVTHFQLLLMEEDGLPLLCHHLLYELGPHVSLQQVRASHIPHSEEQKKLSIPLGDDRTPAKPNTILVTARKVLTWKTPQSLFCSLVLPAWQTQCLPCKPEDESLIFRV